MELLEFLKQIPVPILLIVILVLLVVTIVIAVQYAKQKGLDGIRSDVYELILKAEHLYNESGAGKQKFDTETDCPELVYWNQRPVGRWEDQRISGAAGLYA